MIPVLGGEFFGRLPIINSINLKLPGQRCDDGDKDFLIKDDNIRCMFMATRSALLAGGALFYDRRGVFFSGSLAVKSVMDMKGRAHNG